MLQPYQSKLSRPGLSHPRQQMLPTGNSFGGSNLNNLPSKRFTRVEILSRFGLLTQEFVELSIQFLSLILVTIWFWGLLAAVSITLGWEKKIDPITTAPEPLRVPFMGTLKGS